MFEVPFGNESLTVSLPDCEVTRAQPPGSEAVDVEVAAQRAIEQPHSPSLSTLVDPGDEVAIVVTDVTRATPDDVLLDVLLAELERGGLDREQVTVVIGLGLHRPMSEDEIGEALGSHADIAVNHDPEKTVTVGSVDDCDVDIFEPVARADFVCSTGMVEPHQYAGFSGGAKTVVIGTGGESQIRYSHGPEMLSRDGVRLGRIDDNPFRKFLDEAGDRADVEFCLNVTHGPEGILGASAGRPRAVVEELAEKVRAGRSVPISDTYDAVVAGVSAPKDANLYQATRAPTYVTLGPFNPLREGGQVVVPARLTEGAGGGAGDRRFFEWLSEATDPHELYERMREGYEPGAQRALVVARMLRDHGVTITNSECPDLVEECLMQAADSVGAAIAPGSDVLVVPDALNTLLVEDEN